MGNMTNSQRQNYLHQNQESNFHDSHKSENSDLIIDYLSALGVEYIFGIPGGGIEPLYNALARSNRKKRKPQAIVSRHETGAAFMADGYTRETGRLGVCCATTGPGTTNLITGLACAYADNIPMLIISAQTSLPNFGYNALQESSCTGINTVAMLRHCTRFSTLVSHSDQLEQKLLTAIAYAFSDTPGPAHISIPRNILAAPASDKYQNTRLKAYLEREVMPADDLLQTLSEKINNASQGVFLLGKGSEKALAEIILFAKRLDWPILTTPMGKGVINSSEPMYKGVFGLGGHESANQLIQSDATEVIIAVGTKLSETSTCGWNKHLLSKKLVQIDQNPENFYQSPMACLHIRGCPQLIFQELNILQSLQQFQKTIKVKNKVHAVAKKEITEEAKKDYDILQSNPIKPQHLCIKLSRMCPPDTRFVADSGNSFIWGVHYWECRHMMDLHKNIFRIGMGFSSMCWAIGAAVGTALANRNRPVVCMTGDGSMLMSGQEITVAREQNLNILFVILNDSAYGTVKHGQRIGGAEQFAYKLPKVNFALMAESIGVKSYRINSTEDLEEINFYKFFNQEEPCVLDVIIDGEEIPPIGERVKVLGGK